MGFSDVILFCLLPQRADVGVLRALLQLVDPIATAPPQLQQYRKSWTEVGYN